ncbi:MAG: hypothetical protein GX589_06705, partial [Deltaproteobacteria bacterium]|nr:hypothetical protein [Deltaproteobacteria bacterium]
PMFHSLFRDKLDPSFYGGAPLLGLSHIGIVCHGSAKGRAIMNGIRIAQKLHQENLVENMRQVLSVLDLKRAADFENGMWDRMETRFTKRHGKNSKTKRRTNSSQNESEITVDTQEG